MCKAHYLILLVALHASGCTHLGASRHTLVKDTLVVTPISRLDTTLNLNAMPGGKPTKADTLVLQHERVQLQLVRLHDTLRLQAACAPDTVRIPLVRQLVTPAHNSYHPEGWLPVALLALLALIVLRALKL